MIDRPIIGAGETMADPQELRCCLQGCYNFTIKTGEVVSYRHWKMAIHIKQFGERNNDAINFAQNNDHFVVLYFHTVVAVLY